MVTQYLAPFLGFPMRLSTYALVLHKEQKNNRSK